jgi:hypothetical protein
MYLKNRRLSPVFWLRWFFANLFGTEWRIDQWGAHLRTKPMFMGRVWRLPPDAQESYNRIKADLVGARLHRAAAVRRANELTTENNRLKRRVAAFNTAMRELQRSPDIKLSSLFEVLEERAAALEQLYAEHDGRVAAAFGTVDKLYAKGA